MNDAMGECIIAIPITMGGSPISNDFIADVKKAIVKLGVPLFITRNRVEDQLVRMGLCVSLESDMYRINNSARSTYTGAVMRRRITAVILGISIECDGITYQYVYWAKRKGKNQVFIRVAWGAGGE